MHRFWQPNWRRRIFPLQKWSQDLICIGTEKNVVVGASSEAFFANPMTIISNSK